MEKTIFVCDFCEKEYMDYAYTERGYRDTLKEIRICYPCMDYGMGVLCVAFSITKKKSVLDSTSDIYVMHSSSYGYSDWTEDTERICTDTVATMLLFPEDMVKIMYDYYLNTDSQIVKITSPFGLRSNHKKILKYYENELNKKEVVS